MVLKSLLRALGALCSRNGWARRAEGRRAPRGGPPHAWSHPSILRSRDSLGPGRGSKGAYCSSLARLASGEVAHVLRVSVSCPCGAHGVHDQAPREMWRLYHQAAARSLLNR